MTYESMEPGGLPGISDDTLSTAVFSGLIEHVEDRGFYTRAPLGAVLPALHSGQAFTGEKQRSRTSIIEIDPNGSVGPRQFKVLRIVTLNGEADYNRSRVKQWARDNPEKLKEKRKRENRRPRAARYAASEKGGQAIRRNEKKRAESKYWAPFVCIDSEGRFTGKTIKTGEGLAREQRTFLWGAASAEGEPDWLGHEDKRPLSTMEICEWLCSLPMKFPNARFIGFSINYDITQILAELPYVKAWQILKHLPFYEKDDPTGLKPVVRAIFWDKFAIQYLPRQFFSIGILRDRNKPKRYWTDRNGNKKSEIDYKPGTLMTINDVFGFYQSGLVKVAGSLVASGHATKQELEMLARDKARRNDLGSVPLDEVKKYTALELSLTSRALTQFRLALEDMDVRLKHGWRGAGRIAAAIFDKHGVADEFYPSSATDFPNSASRGKSDGSKTAPEVKTTDISPEQKRAHYAFFGGRIELIKQGYHTKELFGYDIVSAYPAATYELPSMKEGTWKRHKNLGSELRPIENMNMLSMFLVRFRFPVIKKGIGKWIMDKGEHILTGETRFPFFPLPFRQKDASICYPARGMGWYMRDDVVAALKWIEKLCPKDKSAKFEIVRALEFVPASDKKPFGFIPKYFDRRAEFKAQEKAPGGKYNILEKAIKLGINSLYGKTAQAINSGHDGKPPKTANPWYASAITVTR